VNQGDTMFLAARREALLEMAQRRRKLRAEQILFKLFSVAAAGALRPWQSAFYNAQHTLCHLTGDDSYRPDDLQLRVLEEILAEHTERMEI
jgi:hypothetical protein